jgi:hypothetical protein
VVHARAVFFLLLLLASRFFALSLPLALLREDEDEVVVVMS